MTEQTPYYLLDDDGYTATAYIARTPHSPPMRISYRPPVSTTRDRMNTEIGKAVRELEDTDEEVAATAKCIHEAILRQVTGWEVEGVPASKLPPLSAKILGKLPSANYDRIKAITVYGVDGGDQDPLTPDNPPEAPIVKTLAAQGN